MKPWCRHKIFALFCGIFLLPAFMAGMAFAEEASVEGAMVKKYSVGNATVWAIADLTTDRDLGVFANTPEAVKNEYVPSGKAPSAIMVFLVQVGRENILVDTGLGVSDSLMLPGLAEAGVSPADITSVLITHMHGDHIGGLAIDGKKTFPNAQVYFGEMELKFWTSDESAAKYPERAAAFEQCREKVKLYGNAVKTFDFNNMVPPGFMPLDAIGHTPGHAAFLFGSGEEKMLFWGDLVHAAALQFPRPDQNAAYDMDFFNSARSRLYFMELAASQKWPVAGGHLPFAGIGMVEKTASSSFNFVPMP